MSAEVENKPKSIETVGFSILDAWLSNIREGKRIDLFFFDNEYENVAIYGMGRLGIHVLRELKESSIKVTYVIDQKNVQLFTDDIEIVRPEQIKEMKKVDAIVVTPVQYFNEIELNLISCGYEGDIISIAQVVDYISKRNLRSDYEEK